MLSKNEVLDALKTWADSFEIVTPTEDALIRDPSKHRDYYRKLGRMLVVKPQTDSRHAERES
jgi:hypothetical protein